MCFGKMCSGFSLYMMWKIFSIKYFVGLIFCQVLQIADWILKSCRKLDDFFLENRFQGVGFIWASHYFYWIKFRIFYDKRVSNNFQLSRILSLLSQKIIKKKI